MVRLRQIARINPSTPQFDALPDDAELPFVPLEAVWPGKRLDVSRRRDKASVSAGYTRFLEGDILVPKITPTFQADRTVIVRGLEGGIGAGTTELHVVRVEPRADSRYIRYLLSSKSFLDYGEASMIGVAGQKRVPDDCLRDLPVPVTDPTQQRAIADYLDAETARIDALVEKKQRMVEVLDERARRVVDAVTVPTALGGLADIGDAELWKVVQLKRAATFFSDGDWIETPYITDEGIRLIQTGNIGEGVYREQGFRYVSEDTFHEFHCTEVKPGDVLISRLAGPVGRACLAPLLGVKMIAAVDVAILRPKDQFDAAFLVAFLTSSRHLELADVLARGSTMQRLSRSQLGDLPVPMLPLPVQQRVAKRVAEAVAAIRGTEAALSKQITLLLEHRQALITAAVTRELEGSGAAT